MLTQHLSDILMTGRKLRNKLLFDIYDNIDYYLFYKSYFRKTQDEKKFINQFLHTKNAFS